MLLLVVLRFATSEQGEGDPLIHNQKSSLLVHVMKSNVEQRRGIKISSISPYL